MELFIFNERPTIAIIGLGYVGLPLAIAFSEKYKVVGFDIDKRRIQSLKEGHDAKTNCNNEQLCKGGISFTREENDLKIADLFIITVPTPITEEHTPNLTFVESASQTVGRNMKRGAIVDLESTVYPGVTEEICLPLLEKESQLSHLSGDFKIGYSPERINVGDKEHTLKKTIKIVAGQDKETTEYLGEIYGSIVEAGIFKAESIKTAEAAKITENIQRDLNIALVNELSLIFHRLGINTQAVIDAAATKWNFHKYTPGLVGGHCIGVDSTYLTHKAKEVGYDPEIILAGRRLNEKMAEGVVERVCLAIQSVGKEMQEVNILVMGLTFKENVSDIRNSKARDVVQHLKKRGATVIACEPFLDSGHVGEGFDVMNKPFNSLEQQTVDAIILVNKHTPFKEISLDQLTALQMNDPILFDVKGTYRSERKPENLIYLTL